MLKLSRESHEVSYTVFFFGRTEQVVPVSFLEGVLTFRCSSKYKVGKGAKVKLTLVHGQTVQTPTVPIKVVSFEPEGDGTYLCSAALELTGHKLSEIVTMMAYAGVEGPDRRASRRLPCTLRILSKELASFRAVTNNINLTGVELVCDNPVASGHKMSLQFDLESVGVRDLKMEAVCVWSLSEVDDSRKTRYRIGVRFVNEQSSGKAAWTKFYNNLLANEGASVLHKTMDGSSAVDERKKSMEPYPPVLEEKAPPAPAFSAPAIPSQPAVGANPFAPSQPEAPPSQLNLVAPPGAVPPPSQMGGGFATQAAPPPPAASNKLQLPPTSPQKPVQEPGKLHLPDLAPPASSGSPFAPPSLGLPSSPSSPGFSPPSGSPFPPSGAGGFQLPPPTQQTSFPSFELPPSGQAAPPSFGAPPSSGFSFPPSQPAQGYPGSPPTPPSGLGLPPTSESQGLSFLTPPGGGGGFVPKPPEPPSFSFLTPPSSGSGFSVPKPPEPPSFSFSPPGGGFTPPSAPSSGFPTPKPAVGPERVQPLSIEGAGLRYRARQDISAHPGAQKEILLTFEVGGSQTSVAIQVQLTKVEPSADGSCIYSCTVLEDEQRIRVLNQLIGR